MVSKVGLPTADAIYPAVTAHGVCVCVCVRAYVCACVCAFVYVGGCVCAIVFLCCFHCSFVSIGSNSLGRKNELFIFLLFFPVATFDKWSFICY